MGLKTFFTSKAFLAISCFIIGGASVWAVERYRGEKRKEEARPFVMAPGENPESFFDEFFNEDFFGRSRDPFEEMRRMQKRMLKQFEAPHQAEGTFNRWYQKRFGGDVGELQQREDADFIYYELDLQGQKPQEVKVEVNEGQVLIFGTLEAKREEQGTSSFYTSSFQRSFPIPPGVDAEKFTMEQEDKKIIIKFPKIKA